MKITIPTSWEGVTLREYQAYHLLLKDAAEKMETSTNPEVSEFETECAIIALFSGEDMDEILSLHQGAHNRLYNQLAFLQQPIIGKVQTKYTLNGTKYYFEKNADKINGGQWITLQHFLKKDIDLNFHNLIACFAYRCHKYRFWVHEYEPTRHEAVAIDMLDLPMTVVKPLTDFFLHRWEKYVNRTLHFLEITAKELQRKANKLQHSQANTDGSIPLTTSQTDVPNFGTTTST